VWFDGTLRPTRKRCKGPFGHARATRGVVGRSGVERVRVPAGRIMRATHRTVRVARERGIPRTPRPTTCLLGAILSGSERPCQPTPGDPASMRELRAPALLLSCERQWQRRRRRSFACHTKPARPRARVLLRVEGTLPTRVLLSRVCDTRQRVLHSRGGSTPAEGATSADMCAIAGDSPRGP
jgi:hypothetical protein